MIRHTQATLMLLAVSGMILSCADTSAPGTTGAQADAVSDAGTGSADGEDSASEADSIGGEDSTAPNDSASPPDTGEATCPPEATCDDGLTCTVDACVMPGAVCQWAVAPGTCLVNNVCYEAGQTQAGNTCLVCDPEKSPHALSPATEGAACEDGDVCTEAAGSCSADGLCVATPLSCNDDNACTDDACDPALGCVSTPADGAVCFDGDPCTVSDTCAGSVCSGAPKDCEDGDPCTDNNCDGTGECVWVFNAAPCDDASACTVDDTCSDGFCVGVPAVCDDGNACTVDVCDNDVGCAHLPTASPCCEGNASVCDDGNLCTTDLCDLATLDCSYEDNSIPCDDGDACTTDDGCDLGGCNGNVVFCDDGNPCTSDTCVQDSGCVTTPLTGTECSDGLECSVGDSCQVGLCVADTSGCACNVDVSTDMVKLISLQIGADGNPGSGVDVDGNPDTCAPEDTCSNGVDNAFAPVGLIANNSLVDGLDDGDIMLLIGVPAGASGAVEVAVFQGDLDPGNEMCDFQNATCQYEVDSDTVDSETCAPLFTLPGVVDGSSLTAGGPESAMPFFVPLQGVLLNITLYNVRIEATLTTSADGVTSATGLLGGAIKKSTLIQAIQAIPDEDLPIPKETILALLDSLIQYDIDTDKDGLPDAASVGLTMSAIDAVITGID